MGWKPCSHCRLAVGIWNFPGLASHHLEVCVGDLVCVQEELEGWYRGYLYLYPSKQGIFPASHVQPKQFISDGDHIVPKEDPVALEAKESLMEWRKTLFKYFSSGSRQEYIKLLNYMEGVMTTRRNLVLGKMTRDALQQDRVRLTAKIDRVNSMCGLPLNVRDAQGTLVAPDTMSMQQLYTLHQQRQDEIKKRVPHTGWEQQKMKQPLSVQVNHLYLTIKNIKQSFPEDCELFFFLYDHDRKKQISERFLIPLVRSADTARYHGNKPTTDQHDALFTDLGAEEIKSPTLHLVCQVTRRGKMLLDDKKNTSQYPFRRPYAVGVFDLYPALRDIDLERRMSEEEYDYQTVYEMALHNCTTHESDFATFHSTLVKKGIPKQPQKGMSVSFSVKALRGNLEQLRKDFALLINKNTIVVNKLGFPDVILPGDVRSDIYVTLEQGQFEKGSKRAERNVEVAISVCDEKGLVMPGCILPAAGSQTLSEYESFIFYHNNTPRWNETFKLSIPFEKIKTSHLRISFRHVAKNEAKDKMDKTFGFTHLKIIKDDGSIIPDGTHELYIFKTDGNKRWFDPSSSRYLDCNPVKEEISMVRTARSQGRTMSTSVDMGAHIGSSTLAQSRKETVFITTLNCSTKLTQNVNMLALLKWRTVSSFTLPLTLGKVLSIDGEEIVKFLQDTLDCLFGILDQDSEKHGTSVFNALVFIFDMLTNKRYENFHSVLDIYLNKHFSAVLAFRVLLWGFCQRVRLCGDVPQQVELCKMLNSMKTLFQFIVQSHSLYIKTNNHADPSFTAQVEESIQVMCTVLAKSEDAYHGIHTVQAAILRNLPSVLPLLTEAFNMRKIACIVADVLNSMRNSHPSLPAEKTSFILAVMDSPIQLLHTQNAREELVPNIVSHMIGHLEHIMPLNGYKSDDIGNKGCMACIGKVLETLANTTLHVSFTDIEHATPLLLPLLRTSNVLQKSKNPLRAEAQVHLIGLFRIMTDQHYAIFSDSLKSSDRTGVEQLREFLTDLLNCFRSLITEPPYQRSWVILYLSQNSVILRVLKNVSKALLDSFYDERSFSPQIWDVFFELCTVFAAQDCLQLEQHSELRKMKLMREFGDMRLMLGKHVRIMWSKLDDKRGNFIPQLIGPFLEITLLKRRELRELSIPLVMDMMKCEQEHSGNIKRVETEVFDKIDDLVSKGYGDEEYRDMFHETLIPLCLNLPELAQSGPPFLELVRHLIGLLLDYRNVRNDETHRGKRMGCMLNLLNFYKDIEKEELYTRYIYRLAELHEREENYTEAGLTLLLHAETLEWAPELIQCELEGKFTQQTALKRKEALYKEAIRLFDQGKTWECGISLCKELAHLYESQLFDYEKLSGILRTEAEFFHKIITELRVENEYFLVGYYGKGFPLFLRNKTFIHRGQPYERLQAFVKRLADEFPAAEILKSLVIDPELQNSSGMHLQARKVQPISKEKEEFSGKKIPDKIAFYYKTNDVSRFTYDRPFHNGRKDPECEFATLWIERTTYTSSSSFPGVIGWFEVVKTDTVRLNPLDIATETVTSKTREIAQITTEYAAKPSANINPLSMLLKGVIDAAVMGGISNYEKIFFVPKYVQENPDHEKGVNQLKILIEEQVEVLRKALQLHSERVPPELVAFHQDLEQRFQEFQEVVNPELRELRRRSMAQQNTPGGATVRRSATLSRPLPPTPPMDIQQDSNMSVPKRVQRRGTGPPPGRLINTPMKSRATVGATSLLASADRLSMISESTASSGGNTPSHTASSHSDSPVEEIDEYRDDIDNYEIVDLPRRRQQPSSSSSIASSSAPPPSSFPPPLYPAPLPPQKGASEDEDDLHDYEKVTLGGYAPPKQQVPDHSKEFATLPLKKGRPRSPSPSRPIPMNKQASAPGHANYPIQPITPPPSPPEDNFGVLSFPKSRKPKSRSSSPPSTGSDNPIFEDIPSIQRKVFAAGVPAPEAPPINTIPTIASGSASGRPPSQPYFDHLFPNRPLPPDPVDDDVYFDHLASGQSNQTDSGIDSEYSLVGEWTPPINGSSSGSSVTSNGVTVNTTYDTVKQPSPGKNRRKKESSPEAPPKPSPFMKKSPSHSTVPSAAEPAASSGAPSNPPPIPIKKRGSIHYNRVHMASQNSSLVSSLTDPSPLSSTTPGKLPPPPNSDTNWLTTHSYVEIDLPERDPAVRPRPQPRSRSQTVSGRKTQSYYNSSPIALPRKQLASVSSAKPHETNSTYDSPPSLPPSSSSVVSSSVPVSTPPRPPPPQLMSPPPSVPPKTSDRPVLPPRADAPSLPPKPQKPPLPPRAESSGPVIPPRTPKPPPPLPTKK